MTTEMVVAMVVLWPITAVLFVPKSLLATVTSNSLPYAIGPLSCLSSPSVLSCLSVTLVYCGQTVGWIKMPRGTEVGLGPGDIVLDGDPAPPCGMGPSSPPPTFRPMSVVAKWSPISATAELLFQKNWRKKIEGNQLIQVHQELVVVMTVSSSRMWSDTTPAADTCYTRKQSRCSYLR